jgi:hypothetical protein
MGWFWEVFDLGDEGMCQGYILAPKKFDVDDRGLITYCLGYFRYYYR